MSSSPKSTDPFFVRSMSRWTAVGNDSRKGNLKLFLNSCPWFYQKQYSSVEPRVDAGLDEGRNRGRGL